MCWLRAYGVGLPMLLSVLPIACSSTPKTSARDAADANDTGRKLPPNSQSERTLLNELSSLPSGKERRIGNETVVAEPPYAAASSRTCRALHIAAGQPPGTSHRLACTDGARWFFVPDVFGSNASPE